MDIYEMLEKGMSVDEIKAEVDKTAALYREDQEAEKNEELEWAKVELCDAILNFLEASGDVDPELLASKSLKDNLMDVIEDFKDQLKMYSEISKIFEEERAAATKRAETTEKKKPKEEICKDFDELWKALKGI